MWIELADKRQPGMSGPGALLYSEIDAYARITGWPLRPWEVQALCAIDRAFREVLNDD